MGFKCRTDQVDKVLAYIEEQTADELTVSIAVRRKVGKSSYRKVGEAFSADELAAHGTAESTLDAMLDLKCKGKGGWQLITYKGVDEDKKVRTQPVVMFETIADDVSERGANRPADHAIRDLAVQLRQNSDMLGKRLDESIIRSGDQSKQMMEMMLDFTGQERAQQDESAGTVLSLSMQLVETRMKLVFAEHEIERVQRDAASSVVAQIVEKMPPEAMEAAMMGFVAVVGQLGQLAVNKLKGGEQLVAPTPAPAPVAPVAVVVPDDDDTADDATVGQTIGFSSSGTVRSSGRVERVTETGSPPQ
jgi:hypothetical protein